MYIGIDIGGTKILAAARHQDGSLHLADKIATPADAREGMQAIKDLVHKLTENDPVVAIGVATAGPQDLEHGIITHPTNLAWSDVAIVDELVAEFKVPVVFENDAKAAAWAEFRDGAGEDSKALLYVTIGTGVGTALILNGEIYHGSQDTEGGYMPLRDVNGHVTSLEKAVAGPAIIQRFGKTASLLDDAAWQQVAADLALGLTGMIDLIAPDKVVLGGGVAVHFDKFQGPLMSELAKLPHPYPLPPIVQAQHVETAAVLGSLLLAERATIHSA